VATPYELAQAYERERDEVELRWAVREPGFSLTKELEQLAREYGLTTVTDYETKKAIRQQQAADAVARQAAEAQAKAEADEVARIADEAAVLAPLGPIASLLQGTGSLSIGLVLAGGDPEATTALNRAHDHIMKRLTAQRPPDNYTGVSRPDPRAVNDFAIAWLIILASRLAR
jgi:hypothetical protein